MTETNRLVQLETSPHVRIRRVQGEAMLIDLKTQNCFGLNAIGVLVWDGIGTYGTVDPIIEQVLKEFDTGRNTVEADVRNFVHMLLQLGLLIATSHRNS